MNNSFNRIAAFVALSVLSFLLSCGYDVAALPGSRSLVVKAIPLRLDPGDPGRKHFGQFIFLAGFELDSDDSRFGGTSGLALSFDGSMLYAVSDHGYWLSAKLTHDRDGRLNELGRWEITPLLTPEGSPVSGQLRDAESIAQEKDGSLVVSFEGKHRLWRYPPPPFGFEAKPKTLAVPSDLEEAPFNGGIESMTVLADGRLLVITERYENPDGSLKGWLVGQDRFSSISYLASEGYQPTDLANLPDGDILVLERRYNVITGAAMRIQRVSKGDLQPGARLKGKEIIRIERPLVVDNFEGMAVREHPQLGTLVYLISDDNYNPFQRTLLLQFRLENDVKN